MPECLITGYEHRISHLKLSDKNDRHVLAAAIECKAEIIVTANIGDFPKNRIKAFSITAMRPDQFISELLKDYGEAGEKLLLDSVHAIKVRLNNPKVSWTEYFSKLKVIGLRFTVRKLKQLIFVSDK